MKNHVNFDLLNHDIRVACDQGNYEHLEDLLTMREQARRNPVEFLQEYPQYDLTRDKE